MPTLELELPKVGLLVPSDHEQAVSKPDHMKIRLWYQTQEEWLWGSKDMADMAGLEAMTDYVCILKPASKIYDMLWAFMDDFELLKDKGLVQKDAYLLQFDFMLEDSYHLAWVLE